MFSEEVRDEIFFSRWKTVYSTFSEEVRGEIFFSRWKTVYSTKSTVIPTPIPIIIFTKIAIEESISTLYTLTTALVHRYF